jgi:hypothetical protein
MKTAMALLAALVIGVALLAPTAAFAQGNGNGNGQNKDKDKKEKVDPAATPELGSLILLGSGATGMVGYAVLRARTRRRD